MKDSKIGRYPVQRQRFPNSKKHNNSKNKSFVSTQIYNCLTVSFFYFFFIYSFNIKWLWFKSGLLQFINPNFIIFVKLWKLSVVLWTNLQGPSPCPPGWVLGCFWRMCTSSSPCRGYRSRTEPRGSPSCFAAADLRVNITVYYIYNRQNFDKKNEKCKTPLKHRRRNGSGRKGERK